MPMWKKKDKRRDVCAIMMKQPRDTIEVEEILIGSKAIFECLHAILALALISPCFIIKLVSVAVAFSPSS